MNELIEKLAELPYGEWVKLRTAMDRAFDNRKRELERELKLSSAKEITAVIHSQFE